MLPLSGLEPTEIQCAPAEMRKGILRGNVGLHNGGCDLGYKSAPLPQIQDMKYEVRNALVCSIKILRPTMVLGNFNTKFND